jgi:hypothetical protein
MESKTILEWTIRVFEMESFANGTELGKYIAASTAKELSPCRWW